LIIRIVAVGRLREKYWQEAAADFARRLRPYTRLETVEVPEAHIKEAASPAEASSTSPIWERHRPKAGGA